MSLTTQIETSPVVNGQTLGLYLSIPFCRSKCTYCNFASGVYPASHHDHYVQRLVGDLHASRSRAADLGLHLPQTVDSIYFGGGTPVLLSSTHFHTIFGAIREAFMLTPDVEITVECAPGQLSDSTLDALVACGVNRLSLGAQSFIDRECATSGRLHTRADVLADLARLRSAGIHNLNLDLLAGLAGQTIDSWRESLDILLQTAVPHASVYMLEIDEDSRLGRELLQGGARYHAGLVPSDDAIATMYEAAVELFADAGLAQYEISNFAHTGFTSRHNLRYWSRAPYLGLGLDASSMLFAEENLAEQAPASLRFTTAASLDHYLADTEPLAEQSWLGPVQQQEEFWFLGLRRNSGVALADLIHLFGREAVQPSLAVAHQLVADGLLSYEPHLEHFTLSPRGRLLSNNVFAEFLALHPISSASL
jgi:oxygen-independent coproporphyrinogen-3 oxidase